MNGSRASFFRTERYGPWLVALGALSWATDGLFRSRVVFEFSPLLIVFLSHLYALPIAWVICVWQRTEFSKVSRVHWAALLFIGGGSGVAATLLFTRAFAESTNFTVPILLQKTQPVIAIFLSHFLLGERLSRNFWRWSLLALVGVYLICFGTESVGVILSSASARVTLLSLSAALLWAIGIVAGRHLCVTLSFPFVTATRYLIATVVLTFMAYSAGEEPNISRAVSEHSGAFAYMALVSGLLGLMIYYRGLSTTKASVATLCELSYPIGAVLLNWIFLGAALSVAQLVGTCFLITAIAALSLENAKSGL